MDKIKKYLKIIVSIFCLLAVNCVFCNTEDGDKIVILEAGSGNNSSIADLGDNQYRIEFSYPDDISHIKFEMIGLDGSTSYITLQREIQKTYIPPDDVNIQKNYYRYIAYGRLNNASDPSIPYYAYIIRDDKDNILAKGKVPELRASLRDSTITTGSRTLVLTNSYTKPIVISGITNLIYDENLETSEEFTKEKVIPVGGTYNIELRPTTCSGEKTQKKLNDLYVVVYYKIDGIEKKLACVFDLTFFCNAKSNLASKVITTGVVAAVTVTTLIMKKEAVVKMLKDLLHRIRNLKKGSNQDQDKKTDDPEDSDDDDSPDSDNKGDGFDKKPPHDDDFKPKPFHVLPDSTSMVVTVNTAVRSELVPLPTTTEPTITTEVPRTTIVPTEPVPLPTTTATTIITEMPRTTIVPTEPVPQLPTTTATIITEMPRTTIVSPPQNTTALQEDHEEYNETHGIQYEGWSLVSAIFAASSASSSSSTSKTL